MVAKDKNLLLSRHQNMKPEQNMKGVGDICIFCPI